jgi:poly-D-alanine transfer protein DltD
MTEKQHQVSVFCALDQHADQMKKRNFVLLISEQWSKTTYEHVG